ncbi:baculoviral IAP repeat-containing protein 3-like isoform X3 [Mytilus californianus]|uniref:baculoviral IAP repeat-containing protein 3-like isoform X3 n=1 Tax=Mytilus californianus TaxID=6549 RepID=UPI00224591D9|nr:baculoviral IAP repeat-containing protein 3-like isoform X3 [Mytilus californianus]
MCKSYTISNPLQRYSTFVNWPFDESEKKTLADAGFVYTGKEDILKCETCDKTTRYHHWKGKKTPSQAHIDLNRHCEFAKDTSKVTSLYNRLHGRPMYPYYKEYHQRLSSYSSWKFEAIQSSKGLADAGFFSTGEQDETICFSCGLWLTDWQNDEKPWIVHVRYFSKCPYIKEQKTLCFIRNVLEDWQKIYRPMHLNFEDETKRASSFNLFNGRNVCLSPDSLAEAGFFQDGNRFVVCHYCNIRLLTWTTDVNPWEMHARWSGRAQSECQYLVIRKGKHFVDSVLKKYVTKEEKADARQIYAIVLKIMFHFEMKVKFVHITISLKAIALHVKTKKQLLYFLNVAIESLVTSVLFHLPNVRIVKPMLKVEL